MKIKDHRIYLLQVGLKSLGFNPGALDGDEGPKTLAAVSAFKRSLADVAAKSDTSNDFATEFVRIARTQVGIRETSKNRGEGIAKYWTATSYGPSGYDERLPYCAAFVSWCFREALRMRQARFDLPNTAGAYDFERWARENAEKGVEFVTAPKPGDIFTLSATSHVGIVAGVAGEYITTIEGNTDGSGSREGDGVYTRSRLISSVRKFIRATV